MWNVYILANFSGKAEKERERQREREKEELKRQKEKDLFKATRESCG